MATLTMKMLQEQITELSNKVAALEGNVKAKARKRFTGLKVGRPLNLQGSTGRYLILQMRVICVLRTGLQTR